MISRCMLTVRDRLGPDGVGLYQGNAAGFDTTAWAACSWFTRALGTRNRFTSLTLDAVAKPYVAELMSGMPGLVPHPDRDARLVLLLGTNPVVSHGHTVALADPVRRLRSWSHDGELWVIDPRRHRDGAAGDAPRLVSCRDRSPVARGGAARTSRRTPQRTGQHDGHRSTSRTRRRRRRPDAGGGVPGRSRRCRGLRPRSDVQDRSPCCQAPARRCPPGRTSTNGCCSTSSC